MNQRLKRVLALLGILILLAAVIAPMVTAFGTGENSQGYFRASLGMAIAVPIVAYVILLVYRVLGGSKKEPEGKIKNIVFDVGNVLVTYDWKGYLESFHFPKEEEQALARCIFQSDAWNEWDRGLLSSEECLRRFIEGAPQYEEDIRRVIKTAENTIHPVDYADTWTAYLRNKGYKLYILSNYNEEILEKTQKLMTFRKNMEGEIFSCFEKKIKPEREMFELLLSRFGLKPEETVFLDDREENCQGARAVGISAICFHSFEGAVKELEKLGVS